MSLIARQAALAALLSNPGGKDVVTSPALSRLAPSDRRVAHDLILGVGRRSRTWDSILNAFLERGVTKIPFAAKEALRMGAHELLCNDRVPVPIVISECVEIVRQSRKLKGLVNAVLRRMRDSMEACDLLPNPAGPDCLTIQLADGRGIRFNRQVLPEPSEGLATWAADQFSVTPWFAQQMIDTLPLEWEAALRATLSRLPVALRPREGVSLLDLTKLVEDEGGRVLSQHPPILAVQLSGDIGQSKVLQDGQARVQDLVPSEVAPFMDLKPGQRILDLCAAPGGKSVHILELLSGEATLVACAIGKDQLKLLRQSLSVSGFSSTKVHDLGGDGKSWPKGKFDRILLDVPCSNSGVFMKRVGARYRCNEAEVVGLARTQKELLAKAVSSLLPDGKIIYSTCSVLSQENRALVEDFLRSRPEFRLEEDRLRYPHRTQRDGGYMARIGPA
jgi:16S rRNA (cytosine967-C5)-methyltransferase